MELKQLFHSICAIPELGNLTLGHLLQSTIERKELTLKMIPKAHRIEKALDSSRIGWYQRMMGAKLAMPQKGQLCQW